MKIKLSKESKGITLIALCVAVIVLLILTQVTVEMITSDKGIVKEAEDSRGQTIESSERGILNRAKEIAIIYSEDGNFTKELLEKALNDETGADKTEVKKDGEKFKVTFKETGNEYTVEVTNKN